MPPKISTAKKFYEHLELQSQQQYQHLSQDPLKEEHAPIQPL